MINLIRTSGKIIFIAAVFILVMTVGFFAARYIIYTQIKSTIVEELASLRSQGINVNYDHIDVHPWSGKIEFLQLTVLVRKRGQKTGLDATIPYVLIKGVQIVPFLRSNSLVLQEVTAEHASITYAKGGTLLDKDRTHRKIELQEIRVGKVNFPGIDLYVTENPGTDTIVHVLSGVHMREISLQKQLDSLTWKNGEITVSDFALRMYESNIGISATRAVANIQDRSITLDSFRIQPTLSRNAYMRAKGKQTTYMAGLIPHLQLDNVNWYTYPQLTIDVNTITVNLQMDMYRDKRYPFIQKEKRELPVHALHKLPVRISVDSVRIKNSYIRYEEFPDRGDSTGTIWFENIQATILNIHNDKRRKESSRMYATADFMGAGELKALFTFPYDTLQPYRVSGTLSNLQLSSLNNMLGSSARVKVESGQMKTLRFDFSYNDIESNGKVALEYEDLKILTLRNKNDEQAVDHFKTLLLNTIFIKKDVLNNVSSDERSGIIEFTRDQQKSVFNFWWKSVLSGVKSAFYLDKLPGTSSKKSTKKKNSKVKDVLSKIF